MKKLTFIFCAILFSFTSKATIHIVNVWDGYFRFVDAVNFSQDITIQLGDTVQWLPLDAPTMVHSITSTNIPAGATAFDQVWQAPADTFFQYIPQVVGLYEYECTPHAISNGMVGSITVVGVVNSIAEEYATTNDFFIYPNPTTNIICFKESNVSCRYNIYNINGQLEQSGTTTETIDVSAWTNGVYIIEILSDRPKALRLIKQ